jgi:hypothetical protein
MQPYTLLLMYKTILKPIRTYGRQLWDTATTSNIEILECLHSTALRTLVHAEYGYPKESPHTNSYRRNPPLQLSIQRSLQRTPKRPSSEPDNRRLRRHLPNDLPTGFLV